MTNKKPAYNFSIREKTGPGDGKNIPLPGMGKGQGKEAFMCDHHHDHDHGHTHDHDHGHHHTHEHSHSSQAGVSRDRRILEYMIGHNAEHAQEMRELAGRLEETGQKEAAVLILTAAAGFEEANGSLQKALDFME